jgi:hypothetical protein
MTLRIGIDFDNTIACYDAAFRECAKALKFIPVDRIYAKQEMKELILRQPDGETNWQRVQGQVYGRFINHATMFAGVAEFLSRCRRAGADVFIVSHKTDFGHFDEQKINLRETARTWMTTLGFFSSSEFNLNPQQLFFEYTREDKVRRIADLGLDYFIDDLTEVLMEPGFPSRTKKILFSPANSGVVAADVKITALDNWTSISDFVFS